MIRPVHEILTRGRIDNLCPAKQRKIDTFSSAFLSTVPELVRSRRMIVRRSCNAT
jgi:hypothetical protein